MTKYIIAILVCVAALAGLMLYVGDDVTLTLTSSAETGHLAMNPIVLTWQAVIFLGAAAVIAIILFWSLVTWLWHLPARIRSGVGLRRRNQALDAMEDALLAGADGDASKARKKAERARALIRSEDLGRIVSAQAAEACGDNQEAVSHYTAMLSSDKARATGQHGLARNLLATGDLSGAIEQAELAYADNKNARWAFDVLFQAHMASYNWEAAAKTLDQGEKRKHIDKDIARRRRAVLLSAQADHLANTGQSVEATEKAVKAATLAPEFSPAVALSAYLLKVAGDQKKAISLVEKAWAKNPHPALGLAFQDLVKGESERARMKRIDSLLKTNPSHKESYMLEAEEKLRKQDYVGALSVLAPYLTLDSDDEPPTARLCQLAGQIEECLGNMTDARQWYERAATAPLEPDWSDLDPEGDAFDYSEADWRRLTFSFGDTGTLIHPRYESGAPRRRPGLADVKPVPVQVELDNTVEPETAVNEESASESEDTDTELREPLIGKDDLSKRLDSLMDKPDKKL
jgi:HemY protein